MPTEILVLALGVGLLFIHIALQGLLATAELGVGWNAGARDEGLKPKSRFAGRADRALTNFKETFPAFIALALALVVTDQAGGAGASGAWLWFAGRVLYIPLYLFGVPYIRTVAWGIAFVGLFRMFSDLIW